MNFAPTYDPAVMPIVTPMVWIRETSPWLARARLPVSAARLAAVSRSSKASAEPVLAPAGAIARPHAPLELELEIAVLLFRAQELVLRDRGGVGAAHDRPVLDAEVLRAPLPAGQGPAVEGRRCSVARTGCNQHEQEAFTAKESAE